MSKLLIIALFVILSFAAKAGDVKTKPIAKHVEKALHTDSVRVQVRRFNADSLKLYSKSNDFKYDDGIAPEASLWSRFWHWFWNLLSRIFDGATFGHWPFYKFIEYALLVAAVGFLVYVVFKILGIDVVSLFKGKSKAIEIPYAESLENIHEINFDDEIEKAIGNRNYRLAVRLLYLRSLKQLSDAQLIHWQIEKTNSAYINELTDGKHRQDFSLLTRQFEYVWYGDFFIDGQAFQNINTLFQDFKRMLP